MDQEKSLREHLVQLLSGRQAHATFDDAVADIPVHLRGRVHPEAVHTPWQILEHMRIAQWDILEFSRDPRHRSPEFPQGYWPETESPPRSELWEQCIDAFRSDLAAMQTLVADPSADLFAEIAWGSGQTILREALLIADHNSYHLGELVLTRRLLGNWPY